MEVLGCAGNGTGSARQKGEDSSKSRADTHGVYTCMGMAEVAGFTGHGSSVQGYAFWSNPVIYSAFAVLRVICSPPTPESILNVTFRLDTGFMENKSDLCPKIGNFKSKHPFGASNGNSGNGNTGLGRDFSNHTEVFGSRRVPDS